MKRLFTQNTIVNIGKYLDEGSEKAFRFPPSEVTDRLEKYGIEWAHRGLNLFI